MFDALFDSLFEAIRMWLVDIAYGNYENIFGNVDAVVTESMEYLQQTPESWDAAIFGTIRTLSDTVIIPVAGIVLTYVMVYEFLQMMMAGNNFQNSDISMIIKWIIKTTAAILLLSNTFEITMAIFDVAQNVITSGADVLSGHLGLSIDLALEAVYNNLDGLEIPELAGLCLTSFAASLGGIILRIYVFIIVCGRMVQIYLTISLAPIPFATLGNKDLGSVGQGYIKSLVSLAFQGFLLVVCLAIYATVANEVIVTDVLPGFASGATGADMQAAMLKFLGYTVLLCFTMNKTSTISNSIFGAH